MLIINENQWANLMFLCHENNKLVPENDNKFD